MMSERKAKALRREVFGKDSRSAKGVTYAVSGGTRYCLGLRAEYLRRKKSGRGEGR